MKLIKATFEITCSFLRDSKLSAENFEYIKKRNTAQIFVKELIKTDLIKIELDKDLPATPEKPVNTYKAEFFVQTVEEHNESLRVLKHLETAITGLTSANTQETLLRYLYRLKESLTNDTTNKKE